MKLQKSSIVGSTMAVPTADRAGKAMLPLVVLLALAGAVMPLAVSSTPARGNIFVGNSADGFIGEYTNSGATVNTTLITGLEPSGIAISGSNLFVTNTVPLDSPTGNNGSVGEYTTSGTAVNTSLITNLNYPSAIAISGSNIFVVNSGLLTYSGTIGEYSLSGAPINTSLITGLDEPTGIAISGSNLFVTSLVSNPSINNLYTGRIGEYTTSGAPVNASLITGLAGPESIAISGSDLFVANGYTNTIGEYTTSGSTVNASLINIPGDDLPNGIAISGSDLFVANWVPNTIGEYTTSGSTINASLVDVNSPAGIALTPVPEPANLTWMAGGLLALIPLLLKRLRASRSGTAA